MLRAGFSRIDITPDQDQRLIGFAFRYEKLGAGNLGVHDPLSVSVLALAETPSPPNSTSPTADAADRPQADPPALLINLDLATLETAVARTLRQAAADAAETSIDRVVICCTHTHSGPFPVLPQADALDAIREDAVSGDDESHDTENRWREQGARYLRFLTDRVQAAAAMAAGKLTPVTVHTIQAPLGLGYTRRVINAHGGVDYCWNPQEQDHLRPAPAADPTLAVLLLRQTNGPRQFVLWNHGAHSLVLGKTSNVVSADWPGAACRLVERLLPHSRSMFLFGACGDVHPWIATQEDPAFIEPIATAAGGLVASLCHAAVPCASPQSADDAIDDPAASTSNAPQLVVRSKTLPRGRGELDIAAWRIGGVRLLAAPVELFAQLGADLRQRVDGPLLLVTEANGRTGYWPTRDAFAQGGYEVEIARHYDLKPGDGEWLVDELALLAGEV